MIGLSLPVESIVGIGMLLLAGVFVVGRKLPFWRDCPWTGRRDAAARASELLDLIERTDSDVARKHLIAALTSLLEESDEVDL